MTLPCREENKTSLSLYKLFSSTHFRATPRDNEFIKNKLFVPMECGVNKQGLHTM